MPTFRVDACEVKKELPEKDGKGPFVIYQLLLGDGVSDRPIEAELLQKPSTAAPTVGQRIDGTVEKTDFGNRFKKDKPAFNGGGRVEDPKKSAEIRRMACQRAAIELLAVEVAANRTLFADRENLFDVTKASALLLPRIEWLEKDIIAAGEKI